MVPSTKIISILFLGTVMAFAATSNMKTIAPPKEGCVAGAQIGDHIMIQLRLTTIHNRDTSEPIHLDAPWEQQHYVLGHPDTPQQLTDGLQDSCPGEIRELYFTAEEFGIEGHGREELVATVTTLSVTSEVDYAIFGLLQSGQIGQVLDLIEQHKGVNAVDEYGHTPLMAAVQLDQPVVVAALLNSWRPKVDVNFAKPSGHTALFYTIARPVAAGNMIVKALLKRGADPNHALTQKDSRGWTPLHFACKFENVKHAQMLLDFGANPMARTADGLTALDTAADAPYSVRKKLADILNEAVARTEGSDTHSEL